MNQCYDHSLHSFHEDVKALQQGGESTGRRRLFSLPVRGTISEGSIERIRSRTMRSRLQSLGRLVQPLKFVACVALIAGLSWVAIVQLRHLFFSTSYFEIRTIEIEGNRLLKREAVLNLAGVAPAMNVLSLDRQEIRDRLLTHPVIREARIDLSGLYTLRLILTERSPMLYVKAGTAFLEIAEDGMILATGSFGERDLPIVTGLQVEGRKVGESLLQLDSFYEARNWVTGLGDSILKGISELNFGSVQNPYVFLVSGEKIIPKSLEDFRSRYVFLCALLDNLKKNNVEPDTLDMRAPNEIVVKPKRARRPMPTEGSTRRSASAGG